MARRYEAQGEFRALLGCESSNSLMFFALNNGALPRTETIAHTWHTLVLWCHDSHWTCAFGVGKVDNATDPVVSPSTGSAHGVMLIIILNTAHSLSQAVFTNSQIIPSGYLT